MKLILSALGAIALALLGIVGTTSPEDATSNIAGWLRWAGVDKAPAFLASAVADRIIQTVVTIIVTALVCRWWYTRPAPTSSITDHGIDNQDLAYMLGSMARRLRHHRDREWWDRSDDGQDIGADLDALRITLQNEGYAVPFIPEGTDPHKALSTYDEYLTRLGALLSNGHAEQARQLAQHYAEQFPYKGTS